MSRTTKCILMLKILNSRSIVSKKELAQILETNERNINEYKNELIECGYKIDYIVGKYGGYKLDKTSTLPSVKLTEKEKEVLFDTAEKLRKDSSYVHCDVLDSVVSKVLSNTINYDADYSEKFVVERFPLLMDKALLEERYEILDQAIRLKKKVFIAYKGVRNLVNEFTIHPYLLFNSNQGWYVNAYVENKYGLSNKPLNFKLNRIEHIKSLNEVFSPITNYDSKEVVDNNGINFGKKYRVKVILTPPHNVYVQERRFGDNQVITVLDDRHTMLECDMKQIDNIISFLLFFGSSATLIEPKELIEPLKLAEKKMINSISKNKTIFFDFNGTIIDDVDLCLNILNELLNANNLESVSIERYKDIFRFPIKDYYALAGFDFERVSFEDLSKQFIVKYQHPSLNCNLQEHVVEVIKDLIDKGYNIVLLTASKTSNVIEQLKHFNIYNYFNDILGLSDIYAKSKVDIGKDYMKMYNIDPSNAVMIGDTDHDAMVAKEMDIDCILYSKGHQSKKRLLEITDKVIDDFEDIYKYL